MQRTSMFKRSEDMKHPYLSKKGRHQPQQSQDPHGTRKADQMVEKAHNHNDKGLGKVRHGKA